MSAMLAALFPWTKSIKFTSSTPTSKASPALPLGQEFSSMLVTRGNSASTKNLTENKNVDPTLSLACLQL